jgi:RimJ/RimL family protein N-acetyltransferase
MELRSPDPPLQDDVVLLRPPDPADIPAITAACQDPEVPRWTLVPTPYSEDDAREFVERSRQAWSDPEARHGTLVVTERSAGELAGTMSLWVVRPGVGELGYWARREFRGKGYTTRALRIVSRWGFEELGLGRLQLCTFPGNVGSERVAEKVGFQQEGLLRAYIEHRGERRDAMIWSLLPEEFR